MRLNMLALAGICLNVLLMVGLYWVQGGEGGSVKISEMVGVMSGAVTNTPGLGAAQQTVIQAMPSDPSLAESLSQDMSMGYAAAYPLGVVGIIMAMLIIRKLYKIDVDEEIRRVEEDKDKSQLRPHVVTFEVSNDLITGLSIDKLHQLISCNFDNLASPEA